MQEGSRRISKQAIFRDGYAFNNSAVRVLKKNGVLLRLGVVLLHGGSACGLAISIEHNDLLAGGKKAHIFKVKIKV